MPIALETLPTMRQFAIGSNLGVAENVPQVRLNKAFSPESENIILRYDEARRIQGRLKEFLDGDGDKVQTPDANPVIHYYRHLDKNDVEYEFVFTKAHIYRWVQATTSFLEQFACSSDCTMWESVSFNGKVIATNNVDKVIVWDETTPATDFAALDSASGLDTDGGTTYVTKAKYLTTYEGYVIIGFTTEGGTVYPYCERWCSYGDETDWQSTGGSGDAGSKDFKEGKGRLKGFGKYLAYNTNLLIVFKEWSWWPQWLVESADVFNVGEGGTVGLLATHSTVNDKDGKLYFIGSDYTIRELREGVISQRIDKTMRAINTTYQDYIESTFIDEYNELWWSIPSTGSSTGNDKVVAYNVEEKTWETHDFAIRAFGDFTRQTSYTIDQLVDVSATIDGLDASMATIDSVENIVGFPLDLASDYSGYTYDLHSSQTDMGSSYTGSLVLVTDLTDKKSIQLFKRANNLKLFFNGEGTSDYEVTVYAKEDFAASWTSLGSVSLNGNEEIIAVDLPCDLRFRTGKFKLEASNKMEFLGMIIDYFLDGGR